MEEADVNIQGGEFVLFIGVLFVALTGVVGTCTTSLESQIGGGSKGKSQRKGKVSSSLDESSSSSSDGFAKRL